MNESLSSLAALRKSVAALEGRQRADPHARIRTGHDGVDMALGGGFARGKMHELFDADGDATASSAFALILALLAGEGRPLLWLRTDGAARQGGQVYGPGLVDMGVDPACLLLATMPDEATVLKAAADALRCPALGAMLIECPGTPRILDLTASRRLTLAAEAHGVTAFLVRVGAEPAPSAAETRWRVGSAPSAPLAADTPGRSAFDITLLRRRSGPDGLRWHLEWNRDRRCFEPGTGAALSGAVVPVPADGSAADRAVA